MSLGAPGGDELPLEDSLLPGAEARAAAAGETLSAKDVHRLRTTPKRSPHLPTLDETIRRGRTAGYTSRGRRRFGRPR